MPETQGGIQRNSLNCLYVTFSFWSLQITPWCLLSADIIAVLILPRCFFSSPCHTFICFCLLTAEVARAKIRWFNKGMKGQSQSVLFFLEGGGEMFIIYAPSSKVQVNRKYSGVAILVLHGANKTLQPWKLIRYSDHKHKPRQHGCLLWSSGFQRGGERHPPIPDTLTINSTEEELRGLQVKKSCMNVHRLVTADGSWYQKKHFLCTSSLWGGGAWWELSLYYLSGTATL